MKKKLLKSLIFILKAIISLGLLVFLFSKINLQDFLNILLQVKWFYVVFAVIFGFLVWALATYRWQLLLKEQNISISFKRLYFLRLLGIFYSLFLPGQISGDIVRGLKLMKGSHKKETIGVSVAMERIIALLIIFVAGGASLFFLPEIRAELNILSILIIYFLIIFLIIFLFFSKQISSKLYNFLKKPFLKKIFKIIINYQNQPRLMIKIIFLSLLGLISNIFLYYLFLLALNINLSFLTLFLIVPIILIVQMLPISISGLGVREGAVVFLMPFFGVLPEKALAFSLLSFGIGVIVYGLLGALIEIFNLDKS